MVLYDTAPAVRIDVADGIRRGPAAWAAVRDAARRLDDRALIALDAYPGTHMPVLLQQVTAEFPGWNVVDVEVAAREPGQLDEYFGPVLTDDRVFGILSRDTIDVVYDPVAVADLRSRLSARTTPTVLVGWGAAYVEPEPDVLVVAEVARWEIQQRYRAGMANWHAANDSDDALRKYKRGYFVEWRLADRHKRALLRSADFVLDVNDTREPKLLPGDDFRAGLAATVRRPFRLVPFFDPGPWGGTWMKRVCGLPDSPENYAWCFDGVPEENSLVFTDGESTFELPAIDLVLQHPSELLGPRTLARFGAEFPIRFDLLDTMGGGNLSLQVHPLTDYIRDRFGMAYTQDESYYLLDADDDAVVYLGTKDGVDAAAMAGDLARAQRAGGRFDADRYVNAFPARKHDHFSIPAGTVHCSGANSMVLEISATPYIFTFKMWDWGRLGLDGVPRPIHLDHALNSVQWDRDTSWVEANLVGRTTEVSAGEGWVEERTGLHELEFIEVRRHWFTDVVAHDTLGTVTVLNLVEGAEALIESPTGAFAPFALHYAETVIVPAAVGPYSIRPHGAGAGQRLATVKAYVRGTRTIDD